MNSSQKKNTFEPTLLILDGNEVSSQDQRTTPQAGLSEQIYSMFPQDMMNTNLSGLFSGNENPLDYSFKQQHDTQIFHSIPNSYMIPQSLSDYPPLQSQQQQQQSQLFAGSKLNPETSFTSSSFSAQQFREAMASSIRNTGKQQIKTQQTIHHSTSGTQLGAQQSQSASQVVVSTQIAAAGAANIPISNIKGNVKNAYIKKISSLQFVNSNGDLTIAAANQQEVKMNQQQDSDGGEGDFDDGGSAEDSFEVKQQEGGAVQDPSTNRRQKKNRESARNSRQRKKIYIDLLEKKVSVLNRDIEEASTEIEKSQDMISRILSENPLLKGLVQERQAYLEKITNSVGEQSSSGQTNGSNNSTGSHVDQVMVCDSFRLRLGATGHIRKHAIALLFKHMSKALLENSASYFLFGYDPKQHDDDEEFNRCVEIFKEVIGLPDNDNSIYTALPILKKLLDHRKKFKRTFREMKNLEKELTEKARTVETLIDKISPLLTSTQVAQLISLVDKKRQQPELSWMKPRYLINHASNQQQQSSRMIPPANRYTTSLAAAAAAAASGFSSLMTPSQIMSVNNQAALAFGGLQYAQQQQQQQQQQHQQSNKGRTAMTTTTTAGGQFGFATAIDFMDPSFLADQQASQQVHQQHQQQQQQQQQLPQQQSQHTSNNNKPQNNNYKNIGFPASMPFASMNNYPNQNQNFETVVASQQQQNFLDFNQQPQLSQQQQQQQQQQSSRIPNNQGKNLSNNSISQLQFPSVTPSQINISRTNKPDIYGNQQLPFSQSSSSSNNNQGTNPIISSSNNNNNNNNNANSNNNNNNSMVSFMNQNGIYNQSTVAAAATFADFLPPPPYGPDDFKGELFKHTGLTSINPAANPLTSFLNQTQQQQGDSAYYIPDQTQKKQRKNY